MGIEWVVGFNAEFPFTLQDYTGSRSRRRPSAASRPRKVLEGDGKMAVLQNGESTKLRDHLTIKEEERGEDKAIKMKEEEPLPSLHHIKTEAEAPSARQDGQQIPNNSKTSPVFSQDVEKKEDLPSGFSQATPTTTSDLPPMNPITPSLNLVLLSVPCGSGTARSASERFPCVKCGTCFTQKDLLTKHQKTHAPNCDSGDSLEEPKTSHNAEGPHICSVCGKHFYRNNDLLLHQRVHTNDRSYCCPECGKSFSWRTHLLKHQKSHQEKPYPCCECGKSFKCRKNLTQHYRTHTGEKPYSCSECGKHFACELSLREHFRSHTGEKPFSCHECGKSFPTRSTLSNHHGSHTGEKRYSCSECGKGFTSKSSLVVHHRIHTGVKPYSCSECQKCFSDKNSLVHHRLAHTGVKPFPCCECDKSFYNKKPLIRHHERYHAEAKPLS